MKPYISVIIPTTRIGGLDVLLSGLEMQKFKDFELILVDTLYHKRKDLLADKAKQYSFPIKHLIQRDTAIHYCETMNRAFVQADGDIVYTMCDHTWLEKNCLQMHADFHKTVKEKYALIGHFDDCKLPKLHKDFYRSYAANVPYIREEAGASPFVIKERECYNSYMADINSGRLDNMMWSIYDEQFTTDTDPTSFEITLPKEILPIGQTFTNHFFLKNESYILNDIININGFNEALDGAHGWQDWDFSDRLIARTGTKLYSNSNIRAFTMNPRTILYGRLRNTDVFTNEAVWHEGKRSNFTKPINTWSLKDAIKARKK
jgi:glycosyltransferase involved in cell wall biosynthesis